jgi:hypothetical protein
MPLMNVVFGKGMSHLFYKTFLTSIGNLVGNFTGYFVPNSTVTKQEFQKAVNQNAYVDTLSPRVILSCQVTPSR